jgi:hypothetical protein
MDTAKSIIWKRIKYAVMLATISTLVIGIANLAAASLFLFGLKRMSSPVTEVAGFVETLFRLR